MADVWVCKNVFTSSVVVKRYSIGVPPDPGSHTFQYGGLHAASEEEEADDPIELDDDCEEAELDDDSDEETEDATEDDTADEFAELCADELFTEEFAEEFVEEAEEEEDALLAAELAADEAADEPPIVPMLPPMGLPKQDSPLGKLPQKASHAWKFSNASLVQKNQSLQ